MKAPDCILPGGLSRRLICVVVLGLALYAGMGMPAAWAGTPFDATVTVDSTTSPLTDSTHDELAAGGTTFDIDGATYTLTRDITGSGGLTKTGSGTLKLTGSASYTGPTIVQAGTLSFDRYFAFNGTGNTISAGATVTPALVLSERVLSVGMSEDSELTI